MSNRLRASLVPILTWVAVACGGNSFSEGTGGAAGATATGGQVGTGGSATGGWVGTGGTGPGGWAGEATGGFGNVPSYCEVDTSLPAPYATTFKLTNTQGMPLYLYQGCWITHSIKSCADGYSSDLPTQEFCMTECGTGNGCVVCGACYAQPLLLQPGESAEITWSGQLYDVVDGPACACYNSSNAPSGIYRIDVPVFLTPEAAQAQQPSFTVITEFQLPSLGGTVDVSLFVGV